MPPVPISTLSDPVWIIFVKVNASGTAFRYIRHTRWQPHMWPVTQTCHIMHKLYCCWILLTGQMPYMKIRRPPISATWPPIKKANISLKLANEYMLAIWML